MEKTIFEQMGGTYTQVGDYYLPNLQIPEQLKAENQMLWMHQMNNIHNRVMEIINTDLIYV